MLVESMEVAMRAHVLQEGTLIGGRCGTHNQRQANPLNGAILRRHIASKLPDNQYNAGHAY